MAQGPGQYWDMSTLVLPLGHWLSIPFWQADLQSNVPHHPVSRGVDVRVPGFGDTFSMEFLDPSKSSVGM